MWNQMFKGGGWSGRTKSGINLELCLSLLSDFHDKPDKNS